MINVLLGLIIVGLGGSTVFFSPNLSKAFGRNAWAESNLGGTRNAVILFGFVVIVIGVLIMFGMFDSVQSVTSIN